MTKCGKKFTLIELLVAITLLSLIMMLLFQLFSGAQKIWIASEKTNNVYADARVAMELMAEQLNTVQFSYGETTNSQGNVVRDDTKNMIFSLTTGSADSAGNYSSSVVFVSKSPRNQQNGSGGADKEVSICFIAFRRGISNSDEERDTSGKLFMVSYNLCSDTKSDFYKYFPNYNNGSRNDALGSNWNSGLSQKLYNLIQNYSDTQEESENCLVIAENVVSFRLIGYTLAGTPGVLTRNTGTGNDLLKVPPYMIEIQLTVLDPESYTRWRELSGTAQSDYLDQHKRTFTRSVFIGNRWALEAKIPSGGGN